MEVEGSTCGLLMQMGMDVKVEFRFSRWDQKENKARKIKKRFLERCSDVRRKSEYSLKES